MIRRSKSYNSNNIITSLVSDKINEIDPNKYFEDVKILDPTKFKTLTKNVAVASNFAESITYIQTLMTQSIK